MLHQLPLDVYDRGVCFKKGALGWIRQSQHQFDRRVFPAVLLTPPYLAYEESSLLPSILRYLSTILVKPFTVFLSTLKAFSNCICRHGKVGTPEEPDSSSSTSTFYQSFYSGSHPISLRTDGFARTCFQRPIIHARAQNENSWYAVDACAIQRRVLLLSVILLLQVSLNSRPKHCSLRIRAVCQRRIPSLPSRREEKRWDNGVGPKPHQADTVRTEPAPFGRPDTRETQDFL